MSRGFTLVELLFAVAVMAIVIGVAVPSFQNVVRNMRLTASTNDIVASLQLARSEALKRRAPVTVCTSTDAAFCADADWNNGWIVFADDNGDGTRQAAEDLLQSAEEMRDGVDVTLPQGQPMQNFLTYLPSGFPNLGGLAAAGVMVLCDTRASDYYGRVIAVSQTGRPLASAVKDRPDLGVSCE